MTLAIFFPVGRVDPVEQTCPGSKNPFSFSQDIAAFASLIVGAEDVLGKEKALGVGNNRSVPEGEVTNVGLCNDNHYAMWVFAM